MRHVFGTRSEYRCRRDCLRFFWRRRRMLWLICCEGSHERMDRSRHMRRRCDSICRGRAWRRCCNGWCRGAGGGGGGFGRGGVTRGGGGKGGRGGVGRGGVGG